MAHKGTGATAFAVNLPQFDLAVHAARQQEMEESLISEEVTRPLNLTGGRVRICMIPDT